MVTVTRAELGKAFMKLQEERAKAYHRLEDAHKRYLSTRPDYDFETYRSVASAVTQDFKQITEEILALTQQLSDEGHEELAQFITAVQEQEEEKLRLTVCLQLVKQDVQDHPQNPQHWVNKKRITQKLNNVVERINEHLEEVRYEIQEEL